MHLGGAERSLLRLVEDWRARDPGLEVRFITKAPRGLFIEELERRGWPYLALPFDGWAVPAGARHPAEAEARSLAATADMVALMDRERPDLVVTNTLVAPWGAFAAAVHGIPHVWFVREYGDLDHGLEFLSGREATLRDIGLLSRLVVANSIALRDHLATHGVPVEKLAVAYPSVDAAAIEARATEAPAGEPFRPDAGLRVCVVGRVTESKGQLRVTEAIARLHRRGVAAQACFIGGVVDSGYRAEIERRAAAAGIADRIRFADEQPNPWPFVATADVCATASGWEAFGRTTLEAMLLGKPVVGFARGGTAELVADGVTGILSDPDDPDGIARALERYAADPALARSHGEAARARGREIAARDDNAAVIDRMLALVGTEGARLPATARRWFELPTRALDAGATPRALARAAVRRLPPPLARALRAIRARGPRR